MTKFILLSEDQIHEMMDTVVSKYVTIAETAKKMEVASKEWLTSKEVCDLLKISATTMHDWSNKGIIQKHKIGDRIRFRHDQIITSLEKNEF
ncbi:MAG: helix-turn-helix domain-containing protein [Saprospiraceae bacterium]|nr:helix-turn-helix domain-containing protein [Saprospiraceae bacterium]